MENKSRDQNFTTCYVLVTTLFLLGIFFKFTLTKIYKRRLL